MKQTNYDVETSTLKTSTAFGAAQAARLEKPNGRSGEINKLKKKRKKKFYWAKCFPYFVFYIYLFVRLSLCRRQRMPKIRTLFCQVDIKQWTCLTSCVFKKKETVSCLCQRRSQFTLTHFFFSSLHNYYECKWSQCSSKSMSFERAAVSWLSRMLHE